MDLTTLKSRHLQARKASRTDPEATATASVLGRVLGDAETQAKNRPGTLPLDLIAWVASAQRTSLEKELEQLTRLGRDITTPDRELGVLRALESEALALKAQQDAERAARLMSEDELRILIGVVVQAGAGNIGAVMKALKASHEGRYDGAVASRLAREALATHPATRR